MKLEEIFEKYPDETDGFYRRAKFERMKKGCSDISDDIILDAIFKNTAGWLKGLKSWGNQESRDLGFGIPDFMIEDANADDWELYKPPSST